MKTRIEDEYTEILGRIREASEKLNQAGDGATEKIEALEGRLVDIEPGVSAWGDVIHTEETERVDDETGASEAAERRVTIGFGRAKKKWAVVVRDELHGKKKPRDTGFTVPLSSETRALRKADRDLRILALPHLMSVMTAVLAELERRSAPLLSGQRVEQEAEAPALDGASATAVEDQALTASV